MSFTDTTFFIFLPIAILIFYLMPKKLRYIWLLFVSFYFYTTLDNSFTTLLIISILSTWLCGNFIYSCRNKSGRKIIMIFGLLINLGLLIFFKYSNFIINLFSKDTQLSLILPAGISFYTFQSLTYIFDIYNNKSEPENNIFKYALFVSFFPLILSGPIERSKNMLSQFDFEYDFDCYKTKDGLILMLFGYFLKVVISARLNIATTLIFSFYSERSSLVLICGVIAYALQIYCDFQGYSCIAIGVSQIMGINIMQNFRQPYFAVSIADFWRRWHISLSSWFKDYLYIPLGGNRKGTFRKHINLMIVFILSGIWHGASLTFLFWGFLNGLFQVVGDLCKPVKNKLLSCIKIPSISKMLSISATFILICFTWIFFRANSMFEAFDIIKTIFTPHVSSNYNGSFISNFGLGTLNLLIVLFAILLLTIADIICENKKCNVTEILVNSKPIIRWSVYYCLILLVLLSFNLDMTEFIYQAF